jgi:hypothetical protein
MGGAEHPGAPRLHSVELESTLRHDPGEGSPMKVHLGAGMLVGFVVLALGASAAAKPMSDGQIRKAIVSESIASYPGQLPLSLQLGAQRQFLRRAQRLQSAGRLCSEVLPVRYYEI